MKLPKRRWWMDLRHQARRQLHWAAALASLLSWMMIDPAPAAASVVGLQEYMIFGHERQIFDIFEDIYGVGQLGIPSMASVVTFVATSDRQVVYYDHWEDGYEVDILHPVQASTEVYGDDVPLGDVLDAGAVISLNSDQDDSTIHGYVPIAPRDPAQRRYDAGDRVVSIGGPVDLIHALWPQEGTWIGDAFEVYAHQAWITGDRFLVPMGIDTFLNSPTDFPDFQYVYLELSAFEDDTVVEIDNGVKRIDVNLDKGQTFSSLGYIDSTPLTTTLQLDILAGTSVRSNKKLQGGLVTCGSSTSLAQSRFLTLIPEAAWGREYISPVPRTTAQAETEVYIFNGLAHPISVEAHDLAGSGTFTIPASSATAYRVAMGRYVPSGSGLRLRSDDPFWAVAAADTGNLTYDWGYNMVSAEYLAQEYYVSWAPGSADLVSPGVNGSPVWVTPLTDNTVFYVDYSPVDGEVDVTFELDALHTRRIFDPDRDNTGMYLWASGKFAAIWGEDASTAGPGTPYLDLGYTVLPLEENWMEPLLVLEQTITPHTFPTAGGTAAFRLVTSSRDATIAGVDVTDTLPAQWTWVPGTAMVTWPDGSQAGIDPAVTGQDLSWDLSALLAPHQAITVEFEASVSTGGSIGLRRVDDWESSHYAGGTNWGPGSSWVETGDLPSAAPWMDGAVRIVSGPPSYTVPYQGSHQLYLGSTVTGTAICRETDLSAFVMPTLRFKRALDNLEAGDAFYLDVFDGAITHTGVLSWTMANLQDVYAQNELDLAPFASPNTRVCFRSGGVLTHSENLYLDSVEIYDAIAVGENLARAVGVYQNLLLVATDRSAIQISILSLSKQVDKAEVALGEPLVYTLTYGSNASLTLTNALIYDTLPTATTFAGCSPGGVYVSATNMVLWTLPQIGISQTGVLTLAVSADSNPFGAIENRAWIQCDQEGPVPSNRVETVVQMTELSVVKSAPADVAGGETVTFTLTYENRGPQPAAGVVISDLVPAPSTYLSGSLEIDTGAGWLALSDVVDGDAGACDGGWVWVQPGLVPGTVAAGESGRIRFRVRVPEDMPAENVLLNEALYDQAAGEPQYSNLTVTRIHELALDQCLDPTATTPGRLMTYTLVYSNYSTSIYTDVLILDALPQYTSYVPGSAAGADTIEYSWDEGISWSSTEPVTPVTHIRWHDAVLPAGTAGVEVSFVVRVTAPLTEGTVIQNTGYASSASIPVVVDDTLTTVVHTPVLSVTKRIDLSSFSPPAGAPFSYTITVTNTGLGAASNVIVTDVLPAGAVYVAGGSLVGGDTIRWLIPFVPAGDSAEVSLTVYTCQDSLLNAWYRVADSDQRVESPHGLPLVTPVTDPTIETELNYTPLTVSTQSLVRFADGSTTDGGPLVDWAWQFGDGESAGGPTASHVFPAAGTYTVTLMVTDTCGYTGTVSAVIEVIEFALTATKSAMYAAPLVPGGVITYQVVISNGGVLDVTGIELFDPLPAFTYMVNESITLDPPGAGLVGASPPVLARELIIPAGQSVTVTYQVTVSPEIVLGTTITNVASAVDTQVLVTVTSTIGDRVTGVDLGVTKTSSPVPAIPGRAITYTLVAYNQGAGYVDGAVVSDPVPAGLADVSWSCTAFAGAGCTGAGVGDISDIIDLPPWGAVTYTIHGTVEAWVTGTLTNTAIVSAPVFLDELDSSDNTAVDVNTVLPLADLYLGKVADPSPVGMSSLLTFTLSVTNAGPSVARQIVVTDLLAPGVTYLNAEGVGWDCHCAGQVVTCTRDSLAAGALSEVLLTVTSPLTSSLLVNTAMVGAGVLDPDETNNWATVTTTVGAGPLADLSVNKAADNSDPHERETIVYMLTITNSGPEEATGVRLVDLLPAGLLYQTHALSQGSYDQVTGQWDVGALSADSSATLQITVTVAQGMAGTVITNTAGSLSADQADPDPADNEDEAIVVVHYRPALVLDKTGPLEAALGERVVFTFTVTHDSLIGDGSAVAGVAIVDDYAGPAVYVAGDDGDNWLELGESWVLTASYTILPTDPTSLVNTAVVNGMDREGDPVSALDTHTTTIQYNPQIHLTKLGPAAARLGERVRYTFVVANTSFMPTWSAQADMGDGSPIMDVVVTDSLAGPVIWVGGDKNGNGCLDFGEAWTYEAFYVIQPADPDPLVNVATVTGRDRNGDLLTGSDSHSLNIDHVPVLQLQVTGPASVAVGDTIEWFCRVGHAAQSDGSPIHGLVVNNSRGSAAIGMGGDGNGNNLLDVGEIWVYRTSYVVQPSDPSPLWNQCTVTARDADGEPVSGSSGHGVTVIGGEEYLIYLPLAFKSGGP